MLLIKSASEETMMRCSFPLFIFRESDSIVGNLPLRSASASAKFTCAESDDNSVILIHANRSSVINRGLMSNFRVLSYSSAQEYFARLVEDSVPESMPAPMREKWRVSQVQ